MANFAGLLILHQHAQEILNHQSLDGEPSKAKLPKAFPQRSGMHVWSRAPAFAEPPTKVCVNVSSAVQSHDSRFIHQTTPMQGARIAGPLHMGYLVLTMSVSPPPSEGGAK